MNANATKHEKTNQHVTGTREAVSKPAINYDLISKLEIDKCDLEKKIKKEKYKCEHWEDGVRGWVANTDCSVTCRCCGQTFRPEDATVDDVEYIINNMRNLIQTSIYLSSEINHASFPVKPIKLDMDKISDVLLYLDDLEKEFLEIHNEFATIMTTGTTI